MPTTSFFEHQHGQSKGNGNVVPVSALYDQVKPGSGGVEHANGTIQRATHTQMRPPPAPEVKVTRAETGATLCAKEGCQAYPMRELGYCSGHARSLGLIEGWSTKSKKTT